MMAVLPSKTLRLLVILLICGLGLQTSSAEGVPSTMDLELMKRVTVDLSANDAISPFVMSTLMSQLWLATGGSTRAEITPVLGVQEPAPDSFLSSYKSIINYLGTVQDKVITKAFNHVYVSKGFSIRPKFIDYIATYYQGSVGTFSSPTEGAEMINGDVAEATENRIKDIVAPNLLHGSVSVLVSALYFKGTWKHTFNPATSGDFLTVAGDKSVDMMSLNLTELPYVHRGSYDVVSLPYTHDDYCMLLIRPVKRSIAAAEALKNLLNTLDINSIVQDLSVIKIEVSMPRFKLETGYNMNEALSRLGVQGVFIPGADLSGLTEDWRGLYVSAIVHKVFIEVSEEGTEAAGAGAVIIDRSLPKQFTADRPFFAVVYNKLHKINMFTASVADPTQS